MKLIRACAFVLSFCTFIPLAYAQEAPAKPVITIAADRWCPINCVAGSQEEGIAIDLARAIFEPLGYRVEYRELPWARALAETRRGAIMAVVGATKDDAPGFVFPMHEITGFSDDFYVKKGNNSIYTGFDSLKTLKLGIIKDYAYSETLTPIIHENQHDADLIQVVSGDNALTLNIAKLRGGRIDVVIESAPVMNYTLLKTGKQDEVEWVGSTPPDKLYMAFSPALPESLKLARIYDERFTLLAQEHKLDSLYKRYGLVVASKGEE